MIAPADAVDVTSDGKTVWVNSATGCLGRFGRFGIDIHTRDTTGCLHCTHGIVSDDDWEVFKEKMLEHHGVLVGDIYKPLRFT